MGLLRRMIDAQRPLSPQRQQLDTQAYALASAIAQVSTGEMPPDFLEAVMHGGAESFCVNYAAVLSKSDTPEKVYPQLHRHMIDLVEIRGGKGNPQAVSARVDEVLQAVLRDPEAAA